MLSGRMVMLRKKLKTLPSGWFLGAGASAPETALQNINKTGCFEGPEGYLCPKRSSSRSDDEVFALLSKFLASERCFTRPFEAS